MELATMQKCLFCKEKLSVSVCNRAYPQCIIWWALWRCIASCHLVRFNSL